jgi:putative zinc finger/helix-turn-helix YgiT family protein
MINKQYICDNGDLVEENKTTIVERSETYSVKGEPVRVRAKVRICPTCGKDISDEVLDDVALQSAYDVYRRKHNIIFPAEIRALRELYGISQRGLGTVLDWGPITIHRYETGSLPDESHNQVLRFLQDPYNMAKIINANPGAFDDQTYLKISERLVGILTEKAPAKVAEVLGQSSQKKASIFTGFVDFQPEMLMEMIMFFAHRAGGVLKTKLNKLLWYADFVHYKHHTLSISGAAYSHHRYGPVPQNYESFLTALCASDALLVDEIDLGVNADGEVMMGILLSPARDPQLADFGSTAKRVLEDVHAYFAPMGSKKISNLSHKEDGYIATSYKQLISYEYADKIKVDPVAIRQSTRSKTRTPKGRLRTDEIAAALDRQRKR